jgi:uncharacterized membrane protein (UPF0127 family)
MITRRLMLAVPPGMLLLPWVGRAQEAEPTGPQPVLPRERLFIVTKDGKRHEFDVEMALTPEQQETGLMFRKSVGANDGMLFDWGTERDSQMWMKNTLVSLDMVFIRADGTIAAIAEDTTPRSLAVIDSNEPVRATLELAAGTTARLGISVGDRVEGRLFGHPTQG